MDQAKSQTARGMLDIARSSLDEEVREVEGVSTRTEDEWKFYLNTDPSVILIDGRHVYSREPMSLEELRQKYLANPMIREVDIRVAFDNKDKPLPHMLAVWVKYARKLPG